MRRGLVLLAAAVAAAVAGCDSDRLTARRVSRTLEAHGLSGMYIDNLRKSPKPIPMITTTSRSRPVATLPNLFSGPARFRDLRRRGVHYVIVDGTMSTWAYVFDDEAHARRFFGHFQRSVGLNSPSDGKLIGRLLIVRNAVVLTYRPDVRAATNAVAELRR